MADARLRAILDFVDRSKAGVDSASKNVSKLEKALNTADAAIKAFGVVSAAKAAIELGELGAQAQRTEKAFIAISGGSGAAERNLNAMITATNGAISRTDAMAQASRLLQMGLVGNSQELGEMTTMATRLGAAMGLDANAAIESFSLTLANQSIPRLDSFGISASKVRERIAELQAGTAGMTRETAFMIAVQEQGAIAMGRLGDAAQDSAGQIEQNKAAIEDLKTEIGIRLADAVGGANSLVGKLTRGWGDNLRIMNDNTSGIGVLQANFAMLGDILGFTNTAFDQYRAQQESASASTERLNGLTEYYTQRQAEAQAASTLTATAVNQYTAATSGAYAPTQDLSVVIGVARDNAFEAETAFLNSAAALDEMGKSALAHRELDRLQKELDEGRISQEQYTAATRAILTQFGLLTPAEESAEGALATLRQAFLDGKLSAEAYALAVATVKTNIDSLESKTVEVRTVFVEEKRGVGSIPDRPEFQATGGYSAGGATVVGERGPELVQMPRGAQVFTAKETRQEVNNYNFNLTGQYTTGPTQVDDVRTLAMLYGGG